METIYVNEVPLKHKILHIAGDGSCLFSSISYIVHGSTAKATEIEIRAAIVRYAANNWDTYQVYTFTREGNQYETKQAYVQDMSKHTTYGTTSELFAAAEVFHYRFEVYEDDHRGCPNAIFGEDYPRIGRLRLKGNYCSGHFEV